MIVIDRIEGQIAVCEFDDEMKDVPFSIIKGQIRAGALLVAQSDGSFVVDEEATEARTKHITERFERLKNRHKTA